VSAKYNFRKGSSSGARLFFVFFFKSLQRRKIQHEELPEKKKKSKSFKLFPFPLVPLVYYISLLLDRFQVGEDYKKFYGIFIRNLLFSFFCFSEYLGIPTFSIID
jgi:hypothetical protein